MTTVLSIIGASFAAFCIWLTIRIVNRQEKWAMLALAGATLVGIYAGIAIHRLLAPVPSFIVELR